MSADMAWRYCQGIVLMVCKIMAGYSDGTFEHKRWWEGGRRGVYQERSFGVGGFPALLSLLVLLYSNASTTFYHLWFLSCLDSLDTNFRASCPNYDITVLLPISPAPDPACYIEKVCISRYFGNPERNLHIAENVCFINYAHTWWLKGVAWRSKR